MEESPAKRGRGRPPKTPRSAQSSQKSQDTEADEKDRHVPSPSIMQTRRRTTSSTASPEKKTHKVVDTETNEDTLITTADYDDVLLPQVAQSQEVGTSASSVTPRGRKRGRPSKQSLAQSGGQNQHISPKVVSPSPSIIVEPTPKRTRIPRAKEFKGLPPELLPGGRKVKEEEPDEHDDDETINVTSPTSSTKVSRRQQEKIRDQRTNDDDVVDDEVEIRMDDSDEDEDVPDDHADDDLLENTISGGRRSRISRTSDPLPLDQLVDMEVKRTDQGDLYVQVLPERLPQLTRRLCILQLLTGDSVRQNGWMNRQMPLLPPLVAHKAAFVFFVQGSAGKTHRELSHDGLVPWSYSAVNQGTSANQEHHIPSVRPKVRRFPVAPGADGTLELVPGRCYSDTELNLVEYYASLPRHPVLKKKLYYVRDSARVRSTIMVIYEYSDAFSHAPTIVPHGNAIGKEIRQMQQLMGAVPSPRYGVYHLNRAVKMEPNQPPSKISLDGPDGMDELLDDAGMSAAGDAPGPTPPIMAPGRQLGVIGDPLDMDPMQPLPCPFDSQEIVSESGERWLRAKDSVWTQNRRMLLDYLVNRPELVGDHLLPTRPHIPPLIPGRDVFVAFVDGRKVLDQRTLTNDGLSPWSSYTYRAKTRKWGLYESDNGELAERRGVDWRETNLQLVEICTTLARCPRLRKRIMYVLRDNYQIIGNVVYSYEYMVEGEVPRPLRGRSRRKGIWKHAVNPHMAIHAELPMGHMQHAYNRRALMQQQQAARGADGDVDREVDVDGDEMDDELIDVTNAVGDIENLNVAHNVEVLDNGDWVGEAMLAAGAGEQEMAEDEVIDDDCNAVDKDGAAGEAAAAAGDVADDEENSEAFGRRVGHTASGLPYLIVRNRRAACNRNAVLHVLTNPHIMESRGVVLAERPQLPPMVRTAKAFAFFVQGKNVDLRLVNRDALSPWSGGNEDDPSSAVCRTKTRRFAVVRNADSSYSIADGMDWRQAPFQLVEYYSMLHRCSRLRKKVYFVAGAPDFTHAVGLCMVMYDYVEPGNLPSLGGGAVYARHMSAIAPASVPNSLAHMIRFKGVDDDVDEISESERESPFGESMQMLDDTVCLSVIDEDFEVNKNRALHYLINKPHLLHKLGCLNRTVPNFPPLIDSRGTFVFFVDGHGHDYRNFTCDGLGPWSENYSAEGIAGRRPKTRRCACETNRKGELRVVSGARPNMTAFQLVIYTAVLPRLPRLRKKVMYVLKGHELVGNCLIMYQYLEDGDMPTTVKHGNSVHNESPFMRMAPSVQREARMLLEEKSPLEAFNVLQHSRPGAVSSAKKLYNLSRSKPPSRSYRQPGSSSKIYSIGVAQRKLGLPVSNVTAPHTLFEEDLVMPPVRDGPTLAELLSMMRRGPNAQWDLPDAAVLQVEGAAADRGADRMAGGADVDEKKLGQILEGDAPALDGQMDIAHIGLEEVVEGGGDDTTLTLSAVPPAAAAPSQPPAAVPLQMDAVRAGLDAVLEQAADQLGTATEEDTLDALFRLLVARNEQRVLDNCRIVLGMEIQAEEEEVVEHHFDHQEVEGEEHVVVEEQVEQEEGGEKPATVEEQEQVVEGEQQQVAAEEEIGVE